MPNGRYYTVEFEAVAVTAAQDLFYIAPADDKPVLVHALFLGQTTEIGDAMEEGLRIKVIRGHATVGSGGTAATPTAINPSEQAAGLVARVNDTTIASAGTPLDLHSDVWNVRGPYSLILTPEMRWGVSQAAGITLAVRLMAAPADSVTISGTLYLEEMG